MPTIDEMMYISDGHDPFHYIRGRGICGGMVTEDEHYDENKYYMLYHGKKIEADNLKVLKDSIKKGVITLPSHNDKAWIVNFGKGSSNPLMVVVGQYTLTPKGALVLKDDDISQTLTYTPEDIKKYGFNDNVLHKIIDNFDDIDFSDSSYPIHNILGNGIKGGMVHTDIKNPTRLIDAYMEDMNERYEKAGMSDRITTIEEAVDVLENDPSYEPDDKRKMLQKWEGDIEQLWKMNRTAKIEDLSEFHTTGKTWKSARDAELAENILDGRKAVKEALKKYSPLPISRYPHTTIKEEGKIRHVNPVYDLATLEATNRNTLNPNIDINTERGNVTEEFLDIDPEVKILNTLDRDNSQPLNSKNSDAFTDKFIGTLYKKFKGNIDKIDNFLSHYPIDIIKDKTIWEIKSFQKLTNPDTKKFHDMSMSKIRGYKDYSMRYINIGSKDSPEYKLENIYYKIQKSIDYSTGKRTYEYIPTLPEKEKGYNYYWLMNNKDRLAYTNPLANNHFHPIPVEKNNKIEYYKGNWDDSYQPSNPNAEKRFNINNVELSSFPTSYPTNFAKKIKQSKNINIIENTKNKNKKYK